MSITGNYNQEMENFNLIFWPLRLIFQRIALHMSSSTQPLSYGSV